MKRYIIFVGGGIQEKNIIKVLKKHYKIILFDINKNCPCRKLANKFVNISAHDYPKIRNSLKKLKKYNPLCSITFSEHEFANTMLNNAFLKKKN